MGINQESDGTLTITLTPQEMKDLAKRIIHHAEDAHTAVLNFGYLLNEAKYAAKNDFKQPPHPWEPGGPNPGSI